MGYFIEKWVPIFKTLVSSSLTFIIPLFGLYFCGGFLYYFMCTLNLCYVLLLVCVLF